MWGITRKYKTMNWFENFMSGHLNIGKRITIYGENAMQWAVNIHTKKWGYICFRLPFRCFGKWHPLYFYLSPNATPWASTFYIGSGRNAKREAKRARERKAAFGHNFDAWNNEQIRQQLREINDRWIE